jgi:uncharacterized Ntn-hydrolase superfamily protein
METNKITEATGGIRDAESAGGNLIDNDPLVSAIFAAVTQGEGKPIEKLRAVIRAGKIAEAYTDNYGFDSVVATVGGVSSPTP